MEHSVNPSEDGVGWTTEHPKLLRRHSQKQKQNKKQDKVQNQNQNQNQQSSTEEQEKAGPSQPITEIPAHIIWYIQTQRDVLNSQGTILLLWMTELAGYEPTDMVQKDNLIPLATEIQRLEKRAPPPGDVKGAISYLKRTFRNPQLDCQPLDEDPVKRVRCQNFYET